MGKEKRNGPGRPSKDGRPWDYRRWYRENRQQIMEDRKKRYREDPEYREAILKRSAEARAKKRKTKQGKKKAPPPKRGLPKPKVVMIDGTAKNTANQSLRSKRPALG